jgi:hypothetical protein
MGVIANVDFPDAPDCQNAQINDWGLADLSTI